MRFRNIILLVIILLPITVFSQTNNNYSKTNFIPPVNIPITTSGYFAELRDNHFHSGIDIRIGEKEGLQVYSPEEGEVSRIKIQAFGGGKNLYIKHKNGYTTVYMHLQRYCDKIEEYIRKYQYEKQTYEFDISVPKGELRFQKGELIGYAGNTGSSGGPHLHYEIRDTKTEHIINPQNFGLLIQDTNPPEIHSIMICPEGEYSKVEGEKWKKEYRIKKNEKEIGLKENDTIVVTNEVYLGIIAFDKSENSTGRNGLYSYKLIVDDKPIWYFKIDEFSFSDSRYVNACIDYEQYIKTGNRYLISKKLPNNLFSNFITDKENGIIDFEPNQVRKVVYELKDFAGNTTTFQFFLQSTPPTPTIVHYQKNENTYTHLFHWHTPNKIEDEDIKITLPKNALYDDAQVTYSKTKDTTNGSTIYNINSLSPLQLSMTLQIHVPESLITNPQLSSKLLVASLEGKHLYSIGGKIEEGSIIAKTNSFGSYLITFDTIAPTIEPKNFVSSRKIHSSQNTITVIIKDDLSGIAKYNGYINDKWVLMEYDGKSSTLIYNINESELDLQENKLKVIVSDKAGNTTEKVFDIILP